ncbi:hypothetical protein [Alkalimarinus coralli]|uniref:hypothetical protein n=1 Tax=Alkalimarinus coralli TaxID=2935863 RepID=UPI00202AF1A6|nr:hypothetical protein [Alkalimarinus coralli]
MSYPGRSPDVALGRCVQLKTAEGRAIDSDRTGEVSRGHSTGDYSAGFFFPEVNV